MRKWKAFIQGPGLHDELASFNTVETSSNATSQSSAGSDSDGQSAKEFYELIISEPSTSKAASSSAIESNTAAFTAVSKPKVRQKTLTELMRLSDCNDVDKLEEYFVAHGAETDIDAQDQYGYTLLMTAALADALETVELLLKLGSDWSLCEQSGCTAFELARKHRRGRICELIRDWAQNQGEEEDQDSLDPNNSNAEDSVPRSFCDACGVLFKNANQHDRSIAHLVCTHLPGSEKTHYGIPESNKGFQLMLKSGWDRGGLGQSGEGRKFPVKTVLKRDRKGLGVDPVKKVAKVTHFDPFDSAAVETPRRTEAPKTLQKNESQKQRSKERTKEINFRRDFYATD